MAYSIAILGFTTCRRPPWVSPRWVVDIVESSLVAEVAAGRLGASRIGHET